MTTASNSNAADGVREQILATVQMLEDARKSNHERQFGSDRRPKSPMTTGPKTKSARRKREGILNASHTNAQIKLLEAAIKSNEIWHEALRVLHKRIDSGKLSDNMLLRIAASLGKSVASF